MDDDLFHLVRFGLMRLFALAFTGALLASGHAQGQIQLPGAVNPSARGTLDTPPASGTSRSSNLPSLVQPGEETILSRELRLNGSQGLIAFDQKAKVLRITRLTLPGHQISKPQEACRVDVSVGPFVLRVAGYYDGLKRFQSDIASCPLSVDILDGAVSLSVQGGTCNFDQADCTASPAGVWGPPGTAFGPNEIKFIEKARSTSDAHVQAYFRALISQTKDKKLVKDIAADQAGFSAKRDEICRDYVREDQHGFCSLRVTEARALSLSAKLKPDQTGKVTGPPDKRKPPAPFSSPQKLNP